MTHTRKLGVVSDAIDGQDPNDSMPKPRGLATHKSGGLCCQFDASTDGTVPQRDENEGEGEKEERKV